MLVLLCLKYTIPTVIPSNIYLSQCHIVHNKCPSYAVLNIILSQLHIGQNISVPVSLCTKYTIPTVIPSNIYLSQCHIVHNKYPSYAVLNVILSHLHTGQNISVPVSLCTKYTIPTVIPSNIYLSQCHIVHNKFPSYAVLNIILSQLHRPKYICPSVMFSTTNVPVTLYAT